MDRIGLAVGLAATPPAQTVPAYAPNAPSAPNPPNAPNETNRPQIPAAVAEGAAHGPRLSAFARLWQQKENALIAVQDNARLQRRLHQAADLAAQIRQEINTLVKNYPPFPPGSEERVQFLRSVTALRQQLDALTVPPRPDAVPRLPQPPQFPPESAEDAQWQAHAEALGAYQERLAETVAATAESWQVTRMWPEVGASAPARVAPPDEASLQRLAAALKQTPVSLSQAERLGDLGQ